MAVKEKSINMVGDNGNGSNDQLRIETQNLQLKIVLFSTQLELIQQRHNALRMELDMLPGKAAELQKKRDDLVGEFKGKYETLKRLMNVPADKELDLETGNLVARPAQQASQ